MTRPAFNSRNEDLKSHNNGNYHYHGHDRVKNQCKFCGFAARTGGKKFVLYAVRLWRKGHFFRIFLRWRLSEKDPHSEQQSAMKKKSKGNSAVPRPLLPSAMARTPPDNIFLAKTATLRFSLTHHSNSFRSLVHLDAPSLRNR